MALQESKVEPKGPSGWSRHYDDDDDFVPSFLLIDSFVGQIFLFSFHSRQHQMSLSDELASAKPIFSALTELYSFCVFEKTLDSQVGVCMLS